MGQDTLRHHDVVAAAAVVVVVILVFVFIAGTAATGSISVYINHGCTNFQKI
jgi:hypothetical protein